MAQDRLDILVAETFDDSALERLAHVGRLRRASALDEETLAREVPGADALLVRTYAPVTRAVIEAGDRLKVIGRGGVGLENIDLAAARQRGIAVVYTPAAASDSVAEYTIGLMLALERQMVRGDAMVRQDRFLEARGALVGRQLRGLTLGIVGLGRIGGRVGRIACQGLGMTVFYNDIRDIEDVGYQATPVEKARIWSASDVVSLHVPLTRLTRHLVDGDVLARFKPSTMLINTSRGAVVDGEALAAALSAGRLAGAATDVYETEPPRPDDALLQAPNALLSPHVAARTGVGLARMNDVVDDVIAVLSGHPPAYPAPDEEED
jgi:D-3-phosphoglycerate dehydrogenase